MARVKLGLKRPNPEVRLMKKNDPLHSSSDQNLREITNVAEKDQAAIVAATAVNTHQTMVPPSSSASSSASSDGDGDDKQNLEHDHIIPHNLIEGRPDLSVNKAKKQAVYSGQANSDPDHRHPSQCNNDHTRIGCDQPLIKYEPLIIHARDPRVIHTDPGNFMLLVQSLTGSCTTRALCKELEEKQRKRKRNDSTCTPATDEVHEITVDDLTVNDGLQKQKVKIKQQQQKKKKQKKKNHDNNSMVERPADDRQCCSHLAAHHPIQSPHLPVHVLTHESPSTSMDSHRKLTKCPSLETENLSSSPSHRLQDEGSMGSSPNISINDDDTLTPFSKSWNMLTDSMNSSPVMLPSFHGDQHDADCTTAPWKFESIIDSLADSCAKNIPCWPRDDDDVAAHDDGDLCLNHAFQLASARFGGFGMEDHHAEYINESSFSTPPIIDFNVSSLYRSSMPEILDIDSLFACAADQIVQ